MKITITKFYSNIGIIVDSGFCFGFGVLSFFLFSFSLSKLGNSNLHEVITVLRSEACSLGAHCGSWTTAPQLG